MDRSEMERPSTRALPPAWRTAAATRLDTWWMLVPVVGGAAAGSAKTSVIMSGVLNVGQELGPESIEAAAERTAEEIGKVLSEAFKERGWI